MVLEKARHLRMADDIQKARKVNIEWILNNRQELLENFPNRWVAVKNSSPQLVEDELFLLVKVMESRGEAESVVYYRCNSYSPPALFERPVEVILDEPGNN